MKANIISLNTISIKPESNEEKLITDSWYGRKALISPTINNAGCAGRYITYTITFVEKEPKNEK